jgi:DNA-binding NarL/FixJ family response regulator
MRILVVDDHPIMRRGIVHLLGTMPGSVVTSEADSVATALDQVRQNRPDVIVLDLSLGRQESGLDLILRVREAGSSVPILVLSVFDETLHAERVLRAGAQGYLMKESAPDELIDAVRRIARGKSC